MENQFQKIVNVSYLVFAGLLSFLLLVVMMKVSNAYDLESKVKSIELIIRGASLLVGAGAFVLLYSNTKTNSYMNEVVSELFTKVTWPNRKDTTTATVIVLITVVIAGIFFALLDWFFTIGLNWFWATAHRWLS